MHVFIAGVMQGARRDHLIDDQDYRRRITAALQTYLPDAVITDPWALYPDSVNYDADRARRVFLANTQATAKADLLIAYLPTASMGTAMEMWHAFQTNTYIVVVSPLVYNWAILATANEILPDLDALFERIEDGRLRRVVEGYRNGAR